MPVRSRHTNRKKNGKLLPVLAIFFVLGILGSFGSDKDDNKGVEPSGNTSSQTIERASVAQTADTKQDTEERVREFLESDFQFIMAEFQQINTQITVTGTMEGISDREDQSNAPENWDQTQRSMISAQARMRDILNSYSGNTTLSLQDLGGEPMLLIQNGIITYDKYKVDEPEPEPEPEPSSNETISDSESYVWVTSDGSKYHYSSSCSNMKNPSQIKLSTAIASGRTACSKCA